LNFYTYTGYQKGEKAMREQLSSLMHEIWSGWIEYMIKVSTSNPDGTITIPADKVERWKRQRQTQYKDLPEAERNSDKVEADKVLALFNQNQRPQIAPSEISLFNLPLRQYSEIEANMLIEQYKLYVDLADKVSERRNNANTFFLTIHTALLTVLTAFIAGIFEYNVSYGWIIIPATVGLVFSLSWHRLIKSYKELNKGKFALIHQIETYLPANLFSAEWDILKKGDGTVYTPFTQTESRIPWIFASFYIVLMFLATLRLLGCF
jgi:hypothetical protein